MRVPREVVQLIKMLIVQARKPAFEPQNLYKRSVMLVYVQH